MHNFLNKNAIFVAKHITITIEMKTIFKKNLNANAILKEKSSKEYYIKMNNYIDQI